jgi:hypothetical protein
VPTPPEPGQFDWDRPHSGYTFEGQIEDLGDFARGARRRRNRVLRTAALIVLAAIVLPFVLAAVFALVS